MQLHEIYRLQKLAGLNEAFINAPNSFKFNVGDKVYSTYDEDNYDYDSDHEPESFKVISAVEGKSSIPKDTSYTIYYGGNDSRVINGNWYLVRNSRFFHAYYWYPESKLTYDSKGESLEEAFISAPGAKFIIGDTVYDRWDSDKNPLEIIDTVPNMSSIPETPGKPLSLSWDDISRYNSESMDNYWYKVRPIGKKLALWYPQDELSFSPNEGPLEEAFINSPGSFDFEPGDTVEFIYPNDPEVLSIKNYMKQYYFSKNPNVYQVYRVYNNNKYNDKPSLQLSNDEGYITHVALPQDLFAIMDKSTEGIDNTMGYHPDTDLKNITN